MTYPSIKETLYHAESEDSAKKQLVFVVPHGADAVDFLRFFPEIKADAELAKVWPLFMSYLEIERDVGASEIAHGIAAHLARVHHIRSTVVELNYPRGILDGGRLRDHCLRPCLPLPLMDSLKPAMLAVHDTSLAYMDRLYESLETESEDPERFYLIDIHTMASFCPVDASGKRHTIPISLPRLEAYVDQYLLARNHAYQRKIDLICSDETGRLLADPLLLKNIKSALLEQGYACLENEPYHAAPIYLSYQHMQKVPSISLDIPKHLIVQSDENQFDLDALILDPHAIANLSETLSNALYQSFLEAQERPIS